MSIIQNKVLGLSKTRSDINEHLLTLQAYGQKVSHITEFGVRTGMSTWAFLSSFPKKMVSYDIKKLVEVNEIEAAAKNENIDFTFIEADDLLIKIEPTELLFIDTDHTCEQVTKELNLHAGMVSKYIIFHDTTLGYPVGTIPIIVGINAFLESNQEWKIVEHRLNNNGLMVIGRE